MAGNGEAERQIAVAREVMKKRRNVLHQLANGSDEAGGVLAPQAQQSRRKRASKA